jgi:hypothetical protein
MAGKPSLWSRLRSLIGSAAPRPNPLPISTQPEAEPADDAKLDTLDLTIGLDFGTSCSKVVIGDPDWQAQSFAVNFESPGTELRHWLLPTRINQERNLKLRLMAEPDSEQIQNLVAIYIAEVIKRSQAWFVQHAPNVYKRRKANWNLVIGFPEKEFTDSPLSRSYRKVASLAVRLINLDEPITIEKAEGARLAMDTSPSVLPDNCIHFYPEIAAQLAGYINSPFRQRGNLLLIDVGAGTMDVSTLIVHDNAERDIVSFHVCEVKQLGAFRLLERRLAALTDLPGIALKIEPLDFQDALRSMPEQLSDITDNDHPDTRRAFYSANTRFADDVLGSALTCLTRFRQLQREAHINGSFEPWGNSLRFFLTGGGSRSAFFKQHLSDGPLEQRLAQNFIRHWLSDADERRRLGQGLRVERLPLPDRLHNFPSALHGDFDRISVAHGLALGAPNLMKITRSHLA